VEAPGLKEWVSRWATKYPNVEEEDRRLQRYVGAPQLEPGALADLVDWKFQTWASRRSRTHNLLAREDSLRVVELTRRAFACNDELGALLIVCQLSGVGPALGSALLMAHDPDRYTVIDVRALRSVRSLELLPPGTLEATTENWLAYLEACRELQMATDETLRNVDRALYAADGRVDLP
jgi:hypothetical protein